MKLLTFRFDVDTHKCLLQGVPNLLDLGNKHKVKFTFFINLGRSISKYHFLKSKLKREKSDVVHHNLSAKQKLGLYDYLYASIVNPRLVRVGRDVIKRSIAEGFEVGLHGGKNHEHWNQNAETWSEEKILKELEWASAEIKKIHPKFNFKSFAAPHWKHTENVYKALKKHKFNYASDIHTNRPLEVVSKSFDTLHNVPVSISGEPGGVGYLEWCRAKGYSDKKILSDFANKLKVRRNFAVVYDHPYYSGVQELPLLESMIAVARDLDYKIVPLKTIYKNFAQ